MGCTPHCRQEWKKRQFWLRNPGKPRASSACTPARFELYLHPLHHLPATLNKKAVLVLYRSHFEHM